MDEKCGAGGQPGKDVGIHMVQVLVRKSGEVNIEHPRLIKVRAARELIPGPVESTAVGEPTVHDHAQVHTIDSTAGTAEKGQLDRACRRRSRPRLGKAQAPRSLPTGRV